MSLGRVVAALLALGIAPAQIVPDLYVLELTEPAAPSRTRGALGVRESQARVRTAMAARMGRRAEVRSALEVVMNGFIVRAAATGAELAALPGVARVWPVFQLQPELDRVVKTHNIDKAWAQIGGSERAGAGVRIGILDSGLDLNHPAFQSSTMTPPEGFPRATNEAIQSRLNGKVIVYRTYDQLGGYDDSASDESGHGTAVAMVAAGPRVMAPLGEIQGVAPEAWLGIYKVFVGPDGATSNTAIAIKALDDAAADGMDVLNLSFGYLPAIRPDLDALSAAIERAAGLGLAVVKSAGNSGPVLQSGSGPAVGSGGLTVGGNRTDRVFSSGIRASGLDAMPAVPGDGTAPSAPVVAPVRLAGGNACDASPDGSFSGVIVLTPRGDCEFSAKLAHLQAAGAAAVLFYGVDAEPAAFVIGAGGSTLPSMMIDGRDAARLIQKLEETPEMAVEMAFQNTLPFLLDGDGVSSFSSRGPGPDGAIRPDLIATAEEVLTAAQAHNPSGDIYNSSGYAVVYGTSFSSPVVAGSYAVLKSARPGLSPNQYRSLLVNTAQPFPVHAERPARVQAGGAGRLDVENALRGRLSVDPVSLNLGIGNTRANASRRMRVQNVSSNVGTWSVSIDSADTTAPTVEPFEFSLGPGDVVDLQVALRGEVPQGETQGFLLFHSMDAVDGERPQRVAYWYAAPTGVPAMASFVPGAPSSATAGSTVTIAMLVTDATGVATPYETPTVTLLEGSGAFVEAASLERTYPGYWVIRLRVGEEVGQQNRFRIEFGPVIRELSIRGR
ncbi:MAG TPA: S8 family serine peptidase [Bryobacteraceae bacterium]|nr:S8 family serine peptidase [Bryobacteraceae bacterium]